MRRSLSLLLTAMLVVMCDHGIADTPAVPYPWATVSENCQYVFKMVPPKWVTKPNNVIEVERASFGVAYSIDEDGNFAELWRVEGLYTFQAFLSDDGRYLVAMGPWASDQEYLVDLAVAFYADGKLLKEHLVRDLILDPRTLSMSTSHYRWSPVSQSEPNGIVGGSFHLVLSDKTLLSFDLSTGEVIYSDIDENAKTGREQNEADQAEGTRRGIELWTAFPSRPDFEKLFSVSKIEAPSIVRGDELFFPRPTWRAEFAPLEEGDIPVTIQAIFPVDEKDGLRTTLSAQRVSEALEMAFSHPVVQDCFENHDAEHLYLRIAGDYLLWSPEKMRSLLTTIGREPATEDTLRDWAEIVISYDAPPRPTRLYLNTKTGEMLKETVREYEMIPVLYDAKGELIDVR